jgi:hypothetical protein
MIVSYPNSQQFLVALVIMYQPLITSNPALKIVKEHRATADQNENCTHRNAMTVPWEEKSPRALGFFSSQYIKYRLRKYTSPFTCNILRSKLALCLA